MTTAMVRCLKARFPHSEIDMVVREDFSDLIRHSPRISEKIFLSRGSGLRGLRELLGRLNEKNYDLVYDAHRSLRTRLLMPFIRAKKKVYFKKDYIRRALALTFKLPLLSTRRMLERFIDPLLPLGVTYDGRGPEVFVSPTALGKVPDLLEGKSGKWIGFVPTAQWPGKRWPTERFRELAQRLLAQTSHNLFVFGGPADTFCREICEGLPGDRVINLQGKISIDEAGAVLAQCALVVANDTGLMHVADALNVPVVLIFGPTSAEMGCLPFHPLSEIAEVKLWCRPCSKNGEAPCIRRERYCLTRLSTDEIFNRTLFLANRLEKGA